MQNIISIIVNFMKFCHQTAKYPNKKVQQKGCNKKIREHKFSATFRKTHNRITHVPLLPMAISGVDKGDRSNVVAQSVNGSVLITYRQQ